MFVLCDAGGGTVDLISYKITQIQPTFRIEEAAIGSGDKCGATYVDKVRLYNRLLGNTSEILTHTEGIPRLAREMDWYGGLPKDPSSQDQARQPDDDHIRDGQVQL